MENIIGEYSSMLSSYDRSIGQGYLSNADKHPHIVSSLYTHKEKLKKIVEEFECSEILVNKYNLKIFFGFQRPVILSLLLKSKGIDFITYTISKLGDRYHFVKDHMVQSDCLIASIQKYLDIFDHDATVDDIKYNTYEHFNIASSKINDSLFNAIKHSVYTCLHELYKIIKGFNKLNSYKFCGWVPTFFRKIRAKKYWMKYGIGVDSLSDMKTVIFPLHMEPEISLLQISPEFNNSYEIICWVSKNLPADTILVIKENPWSFGIRSKNYYDRLRKIGNVELARLDTTTEEWINRSIFTVAITGTSGYESIYFNKPVLSYGKYQIINYLPTVRYVANFFETRDAIKDLMCINNNVFLKSKYALHKSLMSCGFSLPRHLDYLDADYLVGDLGKILSGNLYDQYLVKFLGSR